MTLQGRGAPSGARMVGVLAGLALALLGASLAQQRGVAPAGAPRRRVPAAAKQAAALCGLQVQQHLQQWPLWCCQPTVMGLLRVLQCQFKARDCQFRAQAG